MKCMRCWSENVAKNGIVRGQQRYYCKDCKYNFIEIDRRTTQEVAILKALSVLINSLGDIPYDDLEELLDRDRSQLHRWNKPAEMRLFQRKRWDRGTVSYRQLEDFVTYHKKRLFDPSIPLYALSGLIINDEFSVILVVQRDHKSQQE